MKALWRIAVLLWVVVAAVAAGAAPRTAPTATSVTEGQLPPKPTGPIAVDYRLVSLPVVGQPLDVIVTARVAGAVGLALETAVTESLALVVVAPAPGVERDGERAWAVTVVPLVGEIGYLNVLVAGEIDGAAQARNVVIPIRVDTARTIANVADGMAVESGGEALILLPVEESP